jgi:hypothetical protein
VPPTVPWLIQCINELFGLVQGALAQQAMTRRETGLELDGVAAVHAAYFEEMAFTRKPTPRKQMSPSSRMPTHRRRGRIRIRRLGSIWRVFSL